MKMTVTALKKIAQQKFTEYMGIQIKLNQIILLEATMDGKDISFKVGKCSYSWSEGIYTAFIFFPNEELKDGIKVERRL